MASYARACVFVHLRACMCASMCMCAHVRAHVRACFCVCVRVHVRVCARVCVCVPSSAHGFPPFPSMTQDWIRRRMLLFVYREHLKNRSCEGTGRMRR